MASTMDELVSKHVGEVTIQNFRLQIVIEQLQTEVSALKAAMGKAKLDGASNILEFSGQHTSEAEGGAS